jgi:hypothetical protein
MLRVVAHVGQAKWHTVRLKVYISSISSISNPPFPNVILLLLL